MDSHRCNTAVCGPVSSAGNMRNHILVLGGTTEARLLGQRLAVRRDINVTLSMAGRTASPAAQSVPVRRGGFGGTAGLTRYLREHDVIALIDATHPYAPTISEHALSAALESHIPMLALRRPAWTAVEGDRWIEVKDAADAVAVLGPQPRNVFLALGRQELAAFASAPQHHYLIRSVDPVEPPLQVPHARYIQERGPFDEAAELTLLRGNAIDGVVAKNSGGQATYGKIAAARTLGIPVMLLRRPPAAAMPAVASVDEAMAWVDHVLGTGCDLGV
jgi:precorrin-6A/cobalt-precorrin-6A reductase